MAYLGNVGKSTFVLQGILAFKVIPGETLGETLGEWRGQLLWKYRRSAFSNFSENEIYDGSLISEHFIQIHLIQIQNRLMFYVYIQIFIQQKAFLLCCRGEGVHMIYIYIWLALQQKIIWPHLSTTKLIRPYLYTLHRDLRVISPFHGSYCRLLDEAIAAMVAIARSSQRAGRICPPWIQRDAEPGLSGAIYHLQRAQWR